jgi:uncharacterized membrane protein
MAIADGDPSGGRGNGTGGAEQADAVRDARVRQVELAISNILRVGVSVSLAVVVLGTIITFVRHPDYRSSPQQLERLTRPGAKFPHTLGEVAAGIGALHGQAIVVLGLILLVATPIVRVAVSILAFVYQGDRVFVVITTIVLCLLLLSFLLGQAGG